MRIRAVIFDLGGVVLGSPLHAIAAFERDCAIPAGFVNRLVADAGPDGAWGRLERGLLDMEAFYPAFEADCAAEGHALDARALFERMAEASQPRAVMLDAIRVLRSRGLRVAALTNNWTSAERDSGEEAALQQHFDAFFESSALGLQKPDRRIYEHACAALAIPPAATVFLDDIGRNLKTARELGMTTIRVESPEQALAELEAVVGFPLRETPEGTRPTRVQSGY